MREFRSVEKPGIMRDFVSVGGFKNFFARYFSLSHKIFHVYKDAEILKKTRKLKNGDPPEIAL